MAFGLGGIGLPDLTQAYKLNPEGAKAGVNSIQSAFGSLNKTGLALTAGLTVPILAIGAFAIKSASDVGKGWKNIALTTGATGQVLEKLKGDFKSVSLSTVGSFADVSTAIADLHQRTGLVGKPLRALATQFLDLSRLTGTDLATNIRSGTRVFAEFGVPVEKQTQLLDQFFKISQKTGIGVDVLMGALDKHATVFKSWGFTVQQSAMVLGQFEKVGINSDTAVTGLRKALITLERDGYKDPQEALKEMIRRVKEAPTEFAAAAVGAELFGMRGGEMATAIRSGALDVEGLSKAVGGGGNAIQKTAEKTTTFSEGLNQVKKAAEFAFQPLGVILINLMKSALPFIEDVLGILTKVTEWFSGLPSWAQYGILGFAGFVAAIGPVVTKGAAVISAIKGISGAFKMLGASMAANPMLWLILAIVAVVAAIVWMIFNWEKVAKFMDETVFPIFEGIGGAIFDFFMAIPDFFADIFGEVFTYLRQILSKIWEVIVWAWNGIYGALVTVGHTIWNFIVYIWQSLWDTIKIVLNAIWQGIVWIWQTIWNSIKWVLTTIWNFIVWVWQSAYNFIVGILTGVWNWVVNAWNGIYAAIKNTLTAIWDWIQNVFNWIWEFISGMVNKVVDWFGGFFERAWEKLKHSWNKLTEWFGNLLTEIWYHVKRLAGGVFAMFQKIGESIWNGFKKGLGFSSPSYVERAVTTMRDNVVDTVRHFPNLYNPMYKAASNLSAGFADGLYTADLPLPTTDMLATAGTTPGALTGTAAAANAANGGGVVVNIASMAVRSDDDIVSVSRELQRLTEQERRAQGVRVI